MTEQSIFVQMLNKQVNFYTETGRKSKNFYIGRNEMKQLKREATELGYICANGEGSSRPEVYGLMVYEVNTDEPFLEVG